MEITSEQIDLAAAAIANARGARRGVPKIANILEMLPDNLQAEVREDAAEALKAAVPELAAPNFVRFGLEKLCKEILTFSGDIGDDDVGDDFWEKALRIELDDCEFGDEVLIEWEIDGYRFEDEGYLTTIPFILEEDRPEFSGVIHVPNPQNPDGIGDVPGEWITIFDAITNPLIISIKPK